MDQTEKQERYKQTINIKFSPFLPCTTQDCTNEATVGTVSYDPIESNWLLISICKDCTVKMVQNYGVDLGQD